MAAGQRLPVGPQHVLLRCPLWPCGDAALGPREWLRLGRTDLCLSAAYGGQLEVLQWLRAEGCPWSYGTCKHAVEQGHVEVLRWARENGAPWLAVTRDRAAAELGYTDDFGNLDFL